MRRLYLNLWEDVCMILENLYLHYVKVDQIITFIEKYVK